ncbi:VENN motif pre-toxin domain-containing protein [Neisseria arctica]|nr:VENN motif pre-toxin domain-containing protein [Neisseria arctica]UOO87655.1 VENN motif pre-toxin domain-containing protein [Neisseria arctica]
MQALGIHSDSSSAHRAVAALPDLAKITEKQQIVAKATADVASAVSVYRQNQLSKAQAALSNAETELMGATFSGNQSDIDAAQGRLNEARENVKAWETGGSKARALNAGTTLITGILGGQSEVQAAVNTASPYTAQLIGQTFGQNGSHPNEALQLIGHALNSGILATVNGGSFEAGAVSGAGSELAAKALTQTLFGEAAAANPNALGEQEKALIKDLSSAFGAVSGGLAGGSALNAQIGGVAGKNAVENNWLGSSTYRRNLAEQAKKGSQEALQLLEIENKLKRYGIADFEALAEEYEKCNGCKSAVAKYQAARNKADAKIVDLIQKGVLTDAELTLLQSKSSERVSAIRKSGYGNMVANAEVKAQADILDFILDARMQRDGVKLTPSQEIGMTLLAGGYGNTPKGSVKPIFTASNQQKTAKNIASSQSRSVNKQEQISNNRKVTESATQTIGKSGYRSIQEFTEAVRMNYQKFYDQGYAQAKKLAEQGKIGKSNREIGSNADQYARVNLRDWLKNEGIKEGPSEIIQINRRLYDPLGSGKYRIPDVYIPGSKTILDGSLEFKTKQSKQIQDFNRYSNGAKTTIIVPSGATSRGSYSIPQ